MYYGITACVGASGLTVAQEEASNDPDQVWREKERDRADERKHGRSIEGEKINKPMTQKANITEM